MEDRRPIENCYWVIPGKFLAGEYPHSWNESVSQAKLKALLQAGVTNFVDLTKSGEGLKPYHHLIQNLSGKPVSFKRFAIGDLSVPSSRDLVVEILDHMDLVMDESGVVYLHCWGGVGRTGTIVGCWLARHGYRGKEAVERLQQLWAHCPKSVTRRSPETAAQVEYILNWDESG